MRQINAIALTASVTSFELLLPAPKRTMVQEQKTATKKSTSALPILSPSKKYANPHTIIGAKLQTIPTVETLKYLML